MTRARSVWLCLLLSVGFIVSQAMAAAAAPATELISQSSGGVIGNGPSGYAESLYASVSSTGRYVAFSSYADNLVPGDTNGTPDVFVRDVASGTTARVSVSSTGDQGEDLTSFAPPGSFNAAISADGRHVAFESTAYNLVPGDTNGTYDIFVRDRTAGTTERVSVSSSGDEANKASERPSISADGRFVVFESVATNLGSTLTQTKIFVHDRVAGTTDLASVSSNGDPAFGFSARPSISGDGRFIVFVSNAGNLVPNDPFGTWDVFVHDRVAGTTELISVSSTGQKGNQGVDIMDPAISFDGRFVAFISGASNLVVGDTNGARDVFLRDRVAHSTDRVSVSKSGAQANAASLQVAISDDGRFVAFASRAKNLVGPTGDTNHKGDIFVRDRAFPGTTFRVSVSTSGKQAKGESYAPRISPDGSTVVFGSVATNLVSGDTNGQPDTFIRIP